MNADTISTLVIVIGFGLFFLAVFVREMYLDYTDQKDLEAYHKKVSDMMNK